MTTAHIRFCIPILFVMLCVPLLSSYATAQDISEYPKKSNEEIYRSMFIDALNDKKIDESEKRLLNGLALVLGLSSDEVNRIQTEILSLHEPIHNKEGEWLLFTQNISWAAGLYGWGIPYVLGAQDGSILIGSEMMSLAGAYYLTAKFTKDKEMPYSRTQMIAWSGRVGFEYGIVANSFREDDEFDKGSVSFLMLGVAGGSLAGDWVWRTTKPSTGMSYMMSFWGENTAQVLSTLHELAVGKEEEFINENENVFWVGNETENPDYKNWIRQQRLIRSLGYPLGLWFSHRYLHSREYSFGDAVLLNFMGGFGFVGGIMFAELFDEGYDSDFSRITRLTGQIGFPILVNNHIRGLNYSFGEAMMVSVGGFAGGLFGMGILAMMEIDEQNPYLIAAMSGTLAGMHLANKRLTPSAEFGNLSSKEPNLSLSLAPLMLLDSDRKLTPGIGLSLGL